MTPPLLALCLIGAPLAACACASVWVTPTATPSPTPTREASPAPDETAAPTSGAVATVSPTRTPSLSSLTITDEAMQHWSDPNDVTGLVHDGTYLWAATHGGVVRWGLDESHRLYTTQDGLPSTSIRGIALDGQGHLWVGYADVAAWSEHDGEGWQTYSAREDAIVARYQPMLDARHFDPRLWYSRFDSHWLWAPTHDGRLESYDGIKWRTYGEHEGITRYTWLVTLSDEGRVWAIGTGVSTAEEGERWWDDHTLFSSIADRRSIRDIAVDSGGVWLAFAGPGRQEGGVTRLDWAANHWEGFLHELTPAIPRRVYRVEIDPDGTVWLCGDHGLVSRQPGRPWKTLPLGDMEVRCFMRDEDGRYWLGTPQGIWSADPDGANLRGPWRVPSPLVGSSVTSLARDAEGRLWIATLNGVSYVDPDGVTEVVASEETFCLAGSPSGMVWFGTRDGLYATEGTSFSRELDKPAIAIGFDADDALWACLEDGQIVKVVAAEAQRAANILDLTGVLPRQMVIDSEGTAWFATSKGLGILSPEGEFHLATVEDGLLSADVRSVAVGPDDAIWMATARGLVRRLPSGKWTRFTTQSTEGGLRSMEMWDVYVEPDGTLWMATTAGISRRTTETDWSYFDVPDARTVLREPGGAVWIGSQRGLHRIKPDVLTPVP